MATKYSEIAARNKPIREERIRREEERQDKVIAAKQTRRCKRNVRTINRIVRRLSHQGIDELTIAPYTHPILFNRMGYINTELKILLEQEGYEVWLHYWRDELIMDIRW